MSGVQQNYILAAIVIIGLALRIYVTGGVTPADDNSMVTLAWRWIEEGAYLPSTHYEARVGLTLPLALIFALSGMGEWQIALLPLAAGVGGMVLAYLFAKNLYGVKAGLVAAAALAVFPLDVHFSALFFPDAIFGAVSAWAVYLAWRAPHKRRPWVWAIASGLVWGFAYLIKIEAFFLGFAYLALFLDRRYRTAVIIAAAACLSVVLAENIIYFIASGEWFHHLKVDSLSNAETADRVDPATRRLELLTLPKAWFITIYNFGLNYYFMFFGLGLLLKNRAPGAALLSLWIGAMLLWLQFGGTMENGQYIMKTKLERYSLYVSVPMAVAIAYAITHFPLPSRFRHKEGARAALLVLLLAVGLFFAHFSILNTEREVSIKRGLQAADDNNLPGLYMDSGTFAIAQLRAKMQGEVFHGQPLETLDLSPAAPAAVNYAMINKSLVAFRNKRYSLKVIDYGQFEQCAERVAVIENPLPAPAYAQMRLLRFVSAPVPVLGERMKHTADDILDPNDVLIYKMDGPARACLLALRAGKTPA